MYGLTKKMPENAVMVINVSLYSEVKYRRMHRMFNLTIKPVCDTHGFGKKTRTRFRLKGFKKITLRPGFQAERNKKHILILKFSFSYFLKHLQSGFFALRVLFLKPVYNFSLNRKLCPAFETPLPNYHTRSRIRGVFPHSF